ncbi:MAG: HAMP domain-containing histidine kinase, partial [Prolixibacteraceae bacterium]|nr:HAMP domain-containing histidine kinase [Prolixibacteraceae bacterium]
MDEKDKRIKQLELQLDEVLNQNKALQEEISDLKNFRMTIFANLSHEIRNPLNGIIGFSEILSTTEVSKEEQHRYSGVVAESSKILMSILNDVLDIARIEANRFNSYVVAFDLNDLIFDLYAEYRAKAEKGKLSLLLDNLISEQFIIHSDPDVLTRILKKLLDNAIKFTKKGWLKLGYRPEEDQIHFWVEDTGIGINETLWSNLFDRFITEEVSRSRNIGGTGLDLSLCNGLSRLLGGKIWYEPKGDQGSV